MITRIMNYNSLSGYIISYLYEFYIVSRISALVRLIIQYNLIFVTFWQYIPYQMNLINFSLEKCLKALWSTPKLAKGQKNFIQFGSVQSSRSVMSDPLWLRGLQHARLPCPSPAPGVYSTSCASSWWYHSTISSSVIPFSSCLQSFPASGSFQMSQFFVSGGQSIGVAASASVLPMNIQDLFLLGWTGWISLQSKGLSRVFSNTTVQK